MRTWLSAALALLVGVLVALPRTARATEGLEWKWAADQERRYLMQANVRLPEYFFVQSPLNKNLRLVEFYVAAVTRCKNGPKAGKRTVELRCTFEDVQYKAAPPQSDAGRGLVELLDQWDELLSQATAQVVFSRDGQVKNISLEGVDTRIRRFREIEETIRLTVVRMFAGLDLELPRKGDDKDESWTQREALALALVTKSGSFGVSRLVLEVKAKKGPVAIIRREGEGTISSGETVGTSGRERPRNTFNMQLQGEAQFDTEKGELVSHDYAVSGEPTPSSTLATGTAGTLYVQAVHVELIPEGAKVAPLGPNEETVPGKNGI